MLHDNLSAQKPSAVYLYRGNYGRILDKPIPAYRDGQSVPFRLLQRLLNGLGIKCEYVVLSAPPQKIPPDASVIYFDLPLASEARWPEGEGDEILFLWEPPSTLHIFNWRRPWLHQKFSRVYTLFDDLVDNKQWLKFYEFQPAFCDFGFLSGFSKRKLCTMICGNKRSFLPRELYSERRSLSEFMYHTDPQNFDYWGAHLRTLEFGWFACTADPAPVKAVFRGRTGGKIECYKNYKFAIIYENMRGRSGYLTAEKLLFPMMAGCVPIYWGADNIGEYVPHGCFIDRRDFSNNEELLSFMREFSSKDYAYFCDSVKTYMEGAVHLLFSPENLVDIIVNSVYPEYPRQNVFTADELDGVYKAKRVMYAMGHLPPDEQKLWGLS